MKTKDRIKEEIGFYKLLMTIMFAIFSSVAGWLFNNAHTINFITEFLLFLISINSFAAMLFFVFEINTKLKELDHE